MSMDVLVTGGTGFLGTALSARLRGDGHRVVQLGSKDADLTRTGTLDRFSPRAYDQIWHLAAWTQAGDFCLRHPGEQWIRNQQINTNVLTWWKERQPQAKLIAMGTSCAYAPDRELCEENYLAGQPIDSLYTYAMTKRMLFVGLEALRKQFELTSLCLVPSTLYGPGYHTDGRQMHFIFDLIRKVLVAQAGGPPPVFWGDGYQRRELVYIDDFVDTAIELAGSTANTLVNIGAGTEHNIREFVEEICRQVGYDSHLVQYDTERYVGARSKVLVVDKLRTLLPQYAPTPLQQGLARTIRWFRTHWNDVVQDSAA